MASKDDWDRLKAAIEGQKLSQWLRRNYADFGRLVSDSKPNWDRIADVFNGMGLTNTRGHKLVGATVRQTWWRVRKELAQPEKAKAAPPNQERPAPQRSEAAPRPTVTLKPARPADPTKPPEDGPPGMAKPIDPRGA